MQSATGMNSLLRQLGSSLGTAVVITVADHKTTTSSANLVRYASPSNPTFVHWWAAYQNMFMAHGSDPSTAHRQALSMLQGLIQQQSTIVGYDYAFAVMGWISLLCLPLVLLMRRGAAADRTVEAD